MLAALALLFLQEEPPLQAPPTERKVVVTASRHETDILDVPSGVTVLTREDIRASNARTLVDLLQGRPGLFVTRNSSTPQDAVVDARGFVNGGGNGQRTLVVVDGRKMNTVSGSNVDWAAIPLENVERVEIVRGPGTAVYGEGAVAAVIRITTRRPEKGAEHRASIEAGSYHSHRETASYGVSAAGISASFFVTNASSDGYRENSDYSGADGVLTLQYLGAWAKLTLHDDARRRPGTLTEAEMAVVGRDGSVTLGDESDVRDRALDLGGDWELAGGTLTPQLGFASGAGDSVTTFSSGTFVSGDESSRVQFGLQYVRAFERVTLVGGLEGALERAEAESSFASPFFASATDLAYDRRLFGAYARAEWRALESVVVSGGLRYDLGRIDHERFTQDTFTPAATIDGDNDFSHVGPSLGVTWHATSSTAAYGSWGKTARWPNRDELVGFLTSALDLDPERARVYEIGVRTREWAWLGGSVAVFAMDVKNEIFFRPPDVGENVFATGDFGSNENLRRVLHRGLEIEAVSAPCGFAELFGTYAFQKTTIARGIHEGNEMPVSPRHTLTLGARLIHGGWTLQAAARYVGERVLINDLDNEVDRLEDYAVLDLKLVYRAAKVTLFVDWTNALGEEYFDTGGIGAGPTGVWGARKAFNPAPEAAAAIGAALEF